MAVESRERGASIALLCLALGVCGCPITRWQGTLTGDATASPSDADVVGIDADVSEADVDVSEADVDVPETDVDVPETDVDVPETDVDVPDVPPDVGCSGATPVSCGATCCAGPCNAGVCEEMIGTASEKSEVDDDTATCAWSRSGRVWCWGSRPGAVPGSDGCNAPVRPVLIAAPSLVDVRQVVVGGRDICALTRLGEVICWNEYAAPRAIATARPAVQLTAGELHVCAVLDDGSVHCRGTNEYGQLGRGYLGAADGSVDEFDGVFRPVQSALGVPLTGVAEVAAGSRYTCARMTDGTVQCWGIDNYRQLGSGPGDGGTSMMCMGHPCSPTPRAVASLRGVAGLDASLNHTCARLASGALWCWGRNDAEQLCRATTDVCDGTSCAASPVEVTGLTGVTAVALGAEHTCVIRGSGAASEVLCCGTWTHHQPVPSALSRIAGFAAGEPTSLSSGAHVACATAQGGVRCWGDRSTGQIPEATPSYGALRVTALSDAVEVAAGAAHTCARTASGGVRCWGRNRNQQLGDALAAGAFPLDTGRPVEAVLHDGLDTPITNTAQLSAGAAHTCATRRDGSLLCWGSNASSQLGRISYSTRVGAEVVPNQIAGVTSSSAGSNFSCSLRAGGVECWGASYHCQTSRGFTGATCTGDLHADAQRVALPTLSPAGVTAGSWHACAWGSVDGARGGPVACWGYNSNGQINDGVPGPDAPPATLAGLSSVVDVSAGVSSTCAVTSDGNVSCWGDYACGALGRPPTLESRVPAVIAGVSNATTVRAGDRFACALVADGAVRCWGRNDYGQLGSRTPRWNYAPTPITRDDGSPLTGAVSLAVGARHACVARSDRTVWCWGDDRNGQRGIGSPSVRTAATAITW